MPRTISTFDSVELDREFDALWRRLAAAEARMAAMEATASTSTSGGDTAGTTDGVGTSTGTTGADGTDLNSRVVGAANPSILAGWMADTGRSFMIVPTGTVAGYLGDLVVDMEMVVDGTLIVASEPGGAAVTAAMRLALPEGL